MAWKQPVFNKTKNSFLNVADIKRIAENLEYIHMALRAGASIPTPDDVAAHIERLLTVTNGSIIYQDDIDWLRAQIAYLVPKYNSFAPNQISEPSFTTVDYIYMNAIELIMFQFKVNVFASWGL